MFKKNIIIFKFRFFFKFDFFFEFLLFLFDFEYREFRILYLKFKCFKEYKK